MRLKSAQTHKVADLKQNLREDTHPFFTDEQLVHFLKLWDWDVEAASFHGLICKAENDAITLPSGISMPNNQRYWLSLAKQFRKNAGGMQRRGDAKCH